MAVVLPLIDELHSPAMRDRHWDTLARHCHVKSIDPTNPKFSMEDMMQLQLHEHKDLVEDLVSSAAKELKIENQLEVKMIIDIISFLRYIYPADDIPSFSHDFR